jgi:hypothetical protein
MPTVMVLTVLAVGNVVLVLMLWRQCHSVAEHRR